MKALSIEQSIFEGKQEVKKLFHFVNEHAAESTAYEMEQAIFVRVMRIGLSAMKCYFAQKGTGDVGETIPSPDGGVAQGLQGAQLCKVDTQPAAYILRLDILFPDQRLHLVLGERIHNGGFNTGLREQQGQRTVLGDGE